MFIKLLFTYLNRLDNEVHHSFKNITNIKIIVLQRTNIGFLLVKQYVLQIFSVTSPIVLKTNLREVLRNRIFSVTSGTN